jgi:sporulation protein YlmC with PRC-barrel domain
MLLIGSKLVGCPVLSLHVGGEVARTKQVIVDPESLRVVAYRVEGALLSREDGDILMTSSVRELSSQGMVIDSVDELVRREDVVVVDKIMKLNFALVGLKVVTRKGKKLGRVGDYTVDSESFMLYQLVVRRPIAKSLIDPELMINRSQIVEVNDYKIVVKDGEEVVKVEEKARDFVPNFVNPFREPNFVPSRRESPDGVDRR